MPWVPAQQAFCYEPQGFQYGDAKQTKEDNMSAIKRWPKREAGLFGINPPDGKAGVLKNIHAIAAVIILIAIAITIPYNAGASLLNATITADLPASNISINTTNKTYWLAPGIFPSGFGNREHTTANNAPQNIENITLNSTINIKVNITINDTHNLTPKITKNTAGASTIINNPIPETLSQKSLSESIRIAQNNPNSRILQHKASEIKIVNSRNKKVNAEIKVYARNNSTNISNRSNLSLDIRDIESKSKPARAMAVHQARKKEIITRYSADISYDLSTCYDTSCYDTSCYDTSCYDTSCYDTSCYDVSINQGAYDEQDEDIKGCVITVHGDDLSHDLSVGYDVSINQGAYDEQDEDTNGCVIADHDLCGVQGGDVKGCDIKEYVSTKHDTNEKQDTHGSQETNVQVYDVEILPDTSPVLSIEFRSLEMNGAEINLGLDNTPETIPSPYGKWEEVYAVNPEGLNFTNATLTAKASGNRLYKCQDWEFENRRCAGEWVFLKHITPGQQYSIEITPDDPGFGEIIATSALHLDSDYGFIRDIYSDIKSLDSHWSGPVYAGQYVRVRFQENLADNSVIDTYIRSNMTYAYIEVYEAGTDNFVGRSGTSNQPEMHYIILSGLSNETAEFDLKIVKLMPDYSDNTTGIDSEAVSFIEFDYIHDQAVSASHADGLVIYSELNVQSPRYRIWNETNDFSPEFTDAPSVGGNINWVVLKASHERDEMIAGTLDKSNNINIFLYNSSREWTILAQVSSDAPSDYRSFDIAYEQVSGDALIVYEDSSGNDKTVNYRVWDGSAFSAQQSLTTDLSSYPANWIMLIPKTGSDNIMLLVHNSNNELYAVPWNGTGFDSSRHITLSTSTVSNTRQHFAYSWEEKSGNGLVMYGEGTNVVYRTYTHSSGSWSGKSTISIGDALTGIRLCSDPASDYIGIIFQDSGLDVNARMWDGDGLLATNPAEDGATEVNGLNTVNVDCAWVGKTGTALFAFVDSNLLRLDYFNFTRIGNQWSIVNLALAPITDIFAADDIEAMRFTPHPTTNEIMIMALDIRERATSIRWTGNSFLLMDTYVLESMTEVQNGNQEGIMFDWYRYDPRPAVRDLIPAEGLNASRYGAVSITANVTDNIAVDTVMALITLPNSTQKSISMTDSDGDSVYNRTFTETSAYGMYNIRIHANDTSFHKNINSTETTYFVIPDIENPSVKGILPTQGSRFNISANIEISVNVTDNDQVVLVIANITLPGSLAVSLELENSGENRYNNSFSIPNITGTYNLSISANDRFNNTNITESSFFIAEDSMNPGVIIISPIGSPVYNLSTTTRINISAEITDHSAITAVYANITMPDMSMQSVSLSPEGGGIYRVLFPVPTPPKKGAYNMLFYAADAHGNSNSTETAGFTLIDDIIPKVIIISPEKESVFPEKSNVTIIANVTDEIGISSVFAEITSPNSSIIFIALDDSDNDGVFNATTAYTGEVGIYDIRILANDTSGNTNNSVLRSFRIQDSSNPIVGLISPSINKVSTNSTILFICSASDNSGLSNISLYHNISGFFMANVTNTIAGTSNSTTFAIQSIPDGVFMWNCMASDLAGNKAFASANRSLSIDTTPPTITSISPAPGTVLDITSNAQFAINMTDSFGIDVAMAEITFPNSTVTTKILLDKNGSGRFNASLTIPLLLGRYNISFYVNDTNDNSNSTVSTYFISVDPEAPVISITGCFPYAANLSDLVTCNASITDQISVESVSATVLMPNSSIIVPLLANSSSNYYFSFSYTNITGLFNVTWLANDTSGNKAETYGNFTVSDRIKPQIEISSPKQGYNTTRRNITFVFNASDNYYSLSSCSIMLDSMINQTNHSIFSGGESLFAVNLINEGVHYWNITCSDGSGNNFTTATRKLSIDYSSPEFTSLLILPESADDLDPGKNITAIAGVFDNITEVSVVILQHKLSAQSKYSNTTMQYNASSGKHHGTFNATETGTYNLRIYTRDILNNSARTTVTNKTLEFDRTWTRSPASFPAIAVEPAESTYLGELFINNTGDYNLTFIITSDSNYTIFNSTSLFTLEKKKARAIRVNDTVMSPGVKTLTLTIGASPNGDPQYQTTTGVMIFSTDQPFLVARFTEPPEDTYTITQGDKNVLFTAEVENLGKKNATNASLYMTIPGGWTITGGSTYLYLGNLSSGESADNSIEVTIPSSFATGDYVIIANTTASNTTGFNLETLGFLLADKAIVTVNSVQASQPVQKDTSDDSGGGSEGGAMPAGPGGGSRSPSPAAGIIDTIRDRSLIETEDIIEVLRGEKVSFPLVITNVFRDSVLTNVTLDPQGFMSRYINHSPKRLTNIGFNRSKNFTVELTIPRYRESEEIEIEFIIKGKIVMTRVTRINATATRTSNEFRDITERRKVKIRITETTGTVALKYLADSEAVMDSIGGLGLSSDRAGRLLQSIKDAMSSGNYDQAKSLSQELAELRDVIFEADALLKQLEKSIAESEEKGLDVTETRKIYKMAKASFEREEYELALKRAKQAELISVLETKGAFNFFNFIMRFWWLIIISTTAAVFICITAYHHIAVAIINLKMENYTKEESAITRLIAELQQSAFAEKVISMDSYHEKMLKFERRSAEIKRLKSKLRMQKIRLVNPAVEIRNLKNENSRIISMIKEAQRDYFERKKITRKAYDQIMGELHRRITEIEEAASIIKTKMVKKQGVDVDEFDFEIPGSKE